MSFFSLAQALLGKGASIEAVRAALEQERSTTPEDRREAARLQDEALLEAYQGHFDLALKRSQEWQARIVAAPDEKTHYAATRVLMDILAEVDDVASLDHIAISFSKQRDAWQQSGYYNYSLAPWSARYRAGTIPRAAFIEFRNGWLEREGTRSLLVAARGTRWIMAFAEPTKTKADATEAVAQLPDYMPMADPLTRTPDFDDAIGLTFLQAGRLAEAIPHLKRAANSCAALDHPVVHTVASLHLGQALEQQHDILAACAAYNVVISRWGNSPRSVTVRTARSRLAALHCSTHAASDPSSH